MDAQKRRRAQKKFKGKEGRPSFLPSRFRVDLDGSVCDTVHFVTFNATSGKIIPTLQVCNKITSATKRDCWEERDRERDRKPKLSIRESSRMLQKARRGSINGHVWGYSNNFYLDKLLAPPEEELK